jgi:hypothetical protein
MKKWSMNYFETENSKERFFWDRFCDLNQNRYDIIEILYKFSRAQKFKSTVDEAAELEPEIQYLLELLELNKKEMLKLNNCYKEEV